MKRHTIRTRILASLALLFLAPALEAASLPPDAPSTDALLARMIDALGGREIVQTTSTVSQRGSISIPQAGLDGTMELRWQAPDHFVAHTDLPGIGRTSQGHDGRSVWRRLPGQDATVLSGFEAEQTLAFADFRGPMTYRKRFSDIAITGFKSYEERDCWTLTLKAGDRYTIHQYVDAETYLIRGVEQIIRDVDAGDAEPSRIASIYERYREVEGRMLLVSWRVVAGGQEQRFNLSEVSLSSHPEGTFERPQPGTKSGPEDVERPDDEAEPDDAGGDSPPASIAAAARPLTELEACVLGVVERYGPCTAYAVRARFAASPTRRWSGSAGAIYPLVRRLAAAAFLSETVRPRGSRSSTRYAVTEEGRAALRQWLIQPADDDGLDNDMISIPVDPVRTRVYFLEALSPAEQRNWVDRVGQQLTAQADALRQEWQEDAFPNEIERLAARGTLDMVEARLRWFASVRARFGST